MTTEEAIAATLLQLAPTFPVIAPQNVTATPRITYLRVSGREWQTLADGAGAPRVRFQIDIWSPLFAQARTLAIQAKDALRAALTIGEITDNPDEFEPDTRLFRASFDIAAWN